MTDPYYVPGRNFTEADAVNVYSEGTRLDKIPGHYPPEDTGSSSLGVAKALKKRGLITGYHHCFSLAAALAALGRGPIIIGIPWFEGFDSPRGDRAELEISGAVRGGHEVCLLEIDVVAQVVRGVNSWGKDWGDGGYFTMSFSTLGRLLADQGDAMQFAKGKAA